MNDLAFVYTSLRKALEWIDDMKAEGGGTFNALLRHQPHGFGRNDLERSMLFIREKVDRIAREG